MQVIHAEHAAQLIKDGDILCCGGFIGSGVAEELHIAVKERFLKTNQPKNITLYYASGQGDKKDRGLNHYHPEGLLGRVIGGHWGLAPKLHPLVIQNKIEAYNLPLGVITHMYRDAAAHKPYTTTHIGLGTFVDPDLDGGKLNEKTKRDIVKKVQHGGKDYLQYETFLPNVCFLKGTFADEDGNISMAKEPLTLEGLAIAIATRNAGGMVVVQVESLVKRASLDPKEVVIPGIFVDYVVVAKEASNHMQTFGTAFNEAFIRSNILPTEKHQKAEPLSIKKIIARRAAMLLSKTDRVLNYGIGAPEFVAEVLNEEGVNDFVPTVEPGAVAGVPAGGLDFGCAARPWAIIDQPYMFDFYDGGGLDFAFLGLAQCDEVGNINVSKFGTTIAGVGGFINITQSTKRLAFLGTFTAGGLEVDFLEEGGLKIRTEGKQRKFLKAVEHVTFSGKVAQATGQQVYYVTERAVFQLLSEGFTLVEIAPGIDLEKDILALMDFKPKISKELREMDRRLFKEARMNLKFT